MVTSIFPSSTMFSKDSLLGVIKQQDCSAKSLGLKTIPWFVIGVNWLPNDKILNWSKLKAFADHKINVTEKFKFVLDG